MTCPHRHSDGAYVLGALGPAERAAYESHLAGCAECAAAVARLAPIPGLLGRADPAALTPAPPGLPEPVRLTELIRAAAGQRRRQRRSRRWRLAAAVVGSVVLAVAGTAVWLGALAADPPISEPMRPVAAEVPVTAQVALAETAAGTEVRMRCAYPDLGPGDDAGGAGYDPSPRVFRLVAVGADGSSEQLGSWLAGLGDEVTMTGITRFTGDDLARIELHDAEGTRLLNYDVP